MPVKYTDEFLNEAYKYMYDNNLGISAVARHFNVDRDTLSLRLKQRRGEIISRKNGKLNVDSNYFEKINTEHKAYWLGFLIADGYVSDHGLELCLGECDKDHVEKFKTDIKSEHKISLKRTKLNDKIFNAYRLHIQDEKLTYDLHQLGLNKDKSNTAQIPFDDIPKEYMNHFIRGLFDGDGCVSRANKTGYCITICTTISEQIIHDITLLVKEELNIDVKYHISKNRNPIDIRIFKEDDVWKFYSWLYENSTVYLKRKYDKFADLRQKHEKS